MFDFFFFGVENAVIFALRSSVQYSSGDLEFRRDANDIYVVAAAGGGDSSNNDIVESDVTAIGLFSI